MADPALCDPPPAGQSLTDYDRAHLKLYVRLLDAEAAGADWREAAEALLGLEVAADPAHAQSLHTSHLARAHWLAARGYHQLLAPGQTPPEV